MNQGPSCLSPRQKQQPHLYGHIAASQQYIQKKKGNQVMFALALLHAVLWRLSLGKSACLMIVMMQQASGMRSQIGQIYQASSAGGLPRGTQNQVKITALTRHERLTSHCTGSFTVVSTCFQQPTGQGTSVCYWPSVGIHTHFISM